MMAPAPAKTGAGDRPLRRDLPFAPQIGIEAVSVRRALSHYTGSDSENAYQTVSLPRVSIINGRRP